MFGFWTQKLRVRRAGTEHNTDGNLAANIDSNSLPLRLPQLGVVTTLMVLSQVDVFSC